MWNVYVILYTLIIHRYVLQLNTHISLQCVCVQNARNVKLIYNFAFRSVFVYRRAYTIRSGDTTVPFSSRLLFSIRFNLVNPRLCWSGVERALRRASIRGVASPASLFGSSACVSLRTYRRTLSPSRSFPISIDRSCNLQSTKS